MIKYKVVKGIKASSLSLQNAPGPIGFQVTIHSEIMRDETTLGVETAGGDETTGEGE